MISLNEKIFSNEMKRRVLPVIDSLSYAFKNHYFC